MSGQSRRSLPEPFGVIALTGGGVLTTGGDAGAGAGALGVGDWLGAVSVVEQRDLRVGAVSVLDEYLALGTVPEVEGLGDDGVVLGLEELLDEVVDEGSLARAEVLAFGGLAVIAGGCIGGGAGG
jgi:hypothetical protein